MSIHSFGMKLSHDCLYIPTSNSSTTITLTSLHTTEESVPFCVRLTHVDVFRAHPCKGALPPGGSVKITISARSDPELLAAESDPRVLFCIGVEGTPTYTKKKLRILVQSSESFQSNQSGLGEHLALTQRNHRNVHGDSKVVGQGEGGRISGEAPISYGMPQRTFHLRLLAHMMRSITPLDGQSWYCLRVYCGQQCGESVHVRPQSSLSPNLNKQTSHRDSVESSSPLLYLTFPSDAPIVLQECISAQGDKIMKNDQIIKVHIVHVQSDAVVATLKLNSKEVLTEALSAELAMKDQLGSTFGHLSFTITMLEREGHASTTPNDLPTAESYPNDNQKKAYRSPGSENRMLHGTDRLSASLSAGRETSIQNENDPSDKLFLPTVQNIVVMVRLRPSNHELTSERTLRHSGSNSSPSNREGVSFQEPQSHGIWKVKDRTCLFDVERSEGYDFDYVFDTNVRNRDVFELAVERFVRGLLDGVHGTLFLYGQSMSGKTYTMFGEGKDIGILPMLLRAVFEAIKTQRRNVPISRRYEVSVSYFEVYHEQVHDLLNLDGRKEVYFSPQPSAEGYFALEGLSFHGVESADEAQQLLYGSLQRATSNLSVLRSDRRSYTHTIFCLRLSALELQTSRAHVRSTELYLVKLAGSEEISELPASPSRMNLTTKNLSLASFKQVVDELAHQEQFVSYLSSSLTKILQKNLAGNAHTLILCCIHPHRGHANHTRSTLKFGQIARRVRMTFQKNTERALTDPTKELQLLSEELDRCLKELNSYRSYRATSQLLQEENMQLKRKLQEAQKSDTFRLHGEKAACRNPSTPRRDEIVGEDRSARHFERCSFSEDSKIQKKIEMYHTKIVSLEEQLAQANKAVMKLQQEVSCLRNTSDTTMRDPPTTSLAREHTATCLHYIENVYKKNERLHGLVQQLLNYLQSGTPVVRVSLRGQTSQCGLFIGNEVKGPVPIAPDEPHAGQSFYIALTRQTPEGQPDRNQILEQLYLKDIRMVVLGPYGSSFRCLDENRRALLRASPNDDGRTLDSIRHRSFEIVSRRRDSVSVWTVSVSDFEAWVVTFSHAFGIKTDWGDALDTSELPDAHALDAAELAFCSTHHLYPEEYVNAKRTVLHTLKLPFLTLLDVRTHTQLDLYQAGKLFAFFLHRGWVRNQNVHYVPKQSLSIQPNRGDVETPRVSSGRARALSSTMTPSHRRSTSFALHAPPATRTKSSRPVVRHLNSYSHRDVGDASSRCTAPPHQMVEALTPRSPFSQVNTEGGTRRFQHTNPVDASFSDGVSNHCTSFVDTTRVRRLSRRLSSKPHSPVNPSTTTTTNQTKRTLSHN